MLGRIAKIMTILVTILITTMAYGYAARMSGGSAHIVHAAAIEHGVASSACGDFTPCNKSDAQMCMVVCVGGLVFLSVPDVETEQGYRLFEHAIETAVDLAGHDPIPGERPPKFPLL
jgi:hypothetical protein